MERSVIRDELTGDTEEPMMGFGFRYASSGLLACSHVCKMTGPAYFAIPSRRLAQEASTVMVMVCPGSGKRWTAWSGAIGSACVWLLFTSAPGHSQAGAPALAVTAPDYIDTSGEPRDQAADHAQRVKLFADSLRADLATSGKFRVTPLDCSSSPCTAATSDPAALVAKAKQAGAAYLLIGGIHKMSTLVQWAKFDILDVNTQLVVFDRLLTFRGDDDTAWKRAETFLDREILQQPQIFKEPD